MTGAADFDERLEAAEASPGWLRNGGFPPAGTTDALAEAERVLACRR